jgi:hypothetical protein
MRYRVIALSCDSAHAFNIEFRDQLVVEALTDFFHVARVIASVIWQTAA